MRLPDSSRFLVLTALALVALPLTACSQDAAADGDVIAIKASDSTCEVAKTALTSGTNTFRVTNEGQKITEVYIYSNGDKIVTERENIGPGTSATLTVQLQPGEYEVACKPGQTGDGIRQAITVTGASSTASPGEVKAVEEYRSFVTGQVEGTLPEVESFVAAVKAGDVAKAKASYAKSRYGWESIEPVAEAFGDLDPAMDARENDVAKGEEWTGWHRIEKQLWAKNNTAGMEPIADGLLKNYKLLISRIPTADITVSSIGNGAKELLDEVATGKVTGEEERYSHTDLVDFEANVIGAEKGFLVIRPLAEKNDPILVKTLDAAFVATLNELAQYGSGANFDSYTTLSKAQIGKLAASVDALAEPLSKLTGAAVQS